MKVYKFDLAKSVCCEVCGEITGMWFDEKCPVCDTEGSDIDTDDFMNIDKNAIIECVDCGAQFKIISN